MQTIVALTMLAGTVVDAATCTRPSSWCSHSGSTYEFKDCDGDGVKDHVCSDFDGNFGVLQSAKNCEDSWPSGICATCTRPSSWCSHSGSTYEFKDCDGDGVKDHVCSDIWGSFGVLQSAKNCEDSWPNGICATCKRPSRTEKYSGWCSHSGSTYEFKDCDGDGVKDHVCSDFDGNFGVLQSSKNCEDSWPYGSCVVDGGWTRLGSGTAVGNLQDYKLGARQQRLGLSLPGDTERLGRSAPLDQYTIPQQGFCVKSNGWDQNSGVIKLDSNGGHSEARHKECWAKCKASGEAVKTGCELIWNQSNQGCYLHTKTIDHGNGVQNHKCWIFPPEPQNGFCVKSNGGDQNSGVIKLDSNGGYSEARLHECHRKCKASGEAVKTGCELIWNQGNQGCYLHTKTISHGNGVQNHKCWIFPPEPQQGFCVKSNGGDQNYGVIKLDSNGGYSEARRDECYWKCKASGEAVKTGCELIWNQGNQGCYLHTSTIDHGNGVQNHKCWIFQNGRRRAEDLDVAYDLRERLTAALAN